MKGKQDRILRQVFLIYLFVEKIIQPTHSKFLNNKISSDSRERVVSRSWWVAFQKKKKKEG